MLAIPLVEGMFIKAIIQSGLPNYVITHKMARENIDLFIEVMGWIEEDLKKLKNLDPAELNIYVSNKYQYKNPEIFLPCPIQDDLIPEKPIDAIKKASYKGVKILIGTNLNKGNMFVHPEITGFPNSSKMVEEMFIKTGNEKNSLSIKEYIL